MKDRMIKVEQAQVRIWEQIGSIHKTVFTGVGIIIAINALAALFMVWRHG